MNDVERDELLTRLDERTARLVRVVDGNGQRGLLHEVEELKTKMAGIVWLGAALTVAALALGVRLVTLPTP
jgi:hypothetical protein